AQARTVEDACALTGRVLARHAADLPFALLYLLDADGKHARLACAAGLEPGMPASPRIVDLEDAAACPLACVARSGQMALVEDLSSRFGPLKGQADPQQQQELVLPVAQAGQERVAGVLVAGVNPRRALDDEYRGFFELVAGQVATALANARAYEEERTRAEALAEIDRAKTLFFSNVSHEFRTPLTLLLGPIEDALTENNDVLSPGQRERIELARRNGLRLLKLVNTLLDFSRVEAGRVEAVYAPTDLASLTAELASMFRSAVERAGLSDEREGSAAARADTAFSAFDPELQARQRILLVDDNADMRAYLERLLRERWEVVTVADGAAALAAARRQRPDL
ncbi:MAG: histidine kinase dimerization/phospho-acceptor domain-containing protein, partial [Ktedonobacteraceae bacterium]